MEDEEDESPRRRRGYEAPPAPWWRPASSWGRVLLGLSVLTVVGGVATAAYTLDRYLEHDPRFRITGTDHIQVTGTTEVTRSQIVPVFGEDIGRNIFFVHLSDRRKQLEQIPWVQHATVMRLLPDQIRVNLVERTPIAFVRNGQQIGLADADGVLLSMPASMMTKRHYSFPVVTGIDPRDALASRRARMAVYQRLMKDLDSTGQRYSEQISEIDLTDPEDARVLMPEQGTDILAHFGDEQFLTRYQRYKAHIAEWRQQYPNLSAVDLRYDQQVVLQMKPGSDSAPTSVNADSGSKTGAAASTSESHSKPAVKPKAKPLSKAKIRAAEKARIAAREKKKRIEAQRAVIAQRAALHIVGANRQGQ